MSCPTCREGKRYNLRQAGWGDVGTARTDQEAQAQARLIANRTRSAVTVWPCLQCLALIRGWTVYPERKHP